MKRMAFEQEYDRWETDILFTTCSNAGGELLTTDNAFSPTMIFCDEAGQVSIAELCVPLTTFTNWQGLVLVGDDMQLEPTVTSKAFNEFLSNARLSPLALLRRKGFPIILLDEQYRMAPALSAFPRRQFYDEKGLKDSVKVQADNIVRQTIRSWTLTPTVNALGPKKEGTEYLLVDIPYGCSRQEPNGTSLVDHANALVVIKTIQALLHYECIVPKMLKVLCYYKGQLRLINRLVREEERWDESVKKAIVVTTVDSFQGKEGQIVILDTVIAREMLLANVQQREKKRAGTGKSQQQPKADQPEDSSDDDHGDESYTREGRVTKHVRNPNPLNVALTRGIDCTIVLCQKKLLQSTVKPARGKRYNCLANMASDAEFRKCVAVNRQLDMDPDALGPDER